MIVDIPSFCLSHWVSSARPGGLYAHQRLQRRAPAPEWPVRRPRNDPSDAFSLWATRGNFNLQRLHHAVMADMSFCLEIDKFTYIYMYVNMSMVYVYIYIYVCLYLIWWCTRRMCLFWSCLLMFAVCLNVVDDKLPGPCEYSLVSKHDNGACFMGDTWVLLIEIGDFAQNHVE